MQSREQVFPIGRVFSFGMGLSLALLISLLAACDRRSEPYAKKGGPLTGAPEYAHALDRASLSGPTNVTEVQPKIKGGPLDAAALYVTNCSACHQATGQGLSPVFPPLAKSPYVEGENVDRLAAIMLYGLSGPINVLGTQYNGVMVGLGPTLKNEELAAIATYIRSSWGNTAAAVGPEVFQAAREKWGSRGAFSIAELGEEK